MNTLNFVENQILHQPLSVESIFITYYIARTSLEDLAKSKGFSPKTLKLTYKLVKSAFKALAFVDVT